MESKSNNPLTLKILVPFLLGIFLFGSVKLSSFLVDKAFESCGEWAIACVWLYPFYGLVINLPSWIISLIILKIFFRKINYQRANLVLVLGTLTFFAQLELFKSVVRFDIYHLSEEVYQLQTFNPIYLPFVYLINYGFLSIVFSNRPVLKKESVSFLIKVGGWIILFFLLPFLFRAILTQIDLYRMNSTAKKIENLPLINNPDDFFHALSPEKGTFLEKGLSSESPFYPPYEVLNTINIEWIKFPGQEQCATEKTFVVDKRWRVFWVQMVNFGKGWESNCRRNQITKAVSGPYRLPENFDIKQYENNFIKRLTK